MTQEAVVPSEMPSLKDLPTYPADFDRHALTFEDLSYFFHLPLGVVSRHLGMGGTVFKKICRKNGIPRWPHRKLCSIEKTIRSLEERLSDPQESPERIRASIERLRAEIQQIKSKPAGCSKEPATKKPTQLTFLKWEPTQSQGRSNSQFTVIPSPGDGEQLSSPPSSPILSPLPVESSPCADIPDTSSDAPRPLLVMEPDLNLQATPFGLIHTWQIPSFMMMQGQLSP